MLGRKQGKVYNNFGSKLLNVPMSFGDKMNHRTHHQNYVEEENDEKKMHSDLERRHADHSENPINERRRHHH